MGQPILTDENQLPTKEVIYSLIGKSRVLWDSVFEHIRSNFPQLVEEWKYYKDGKSWLLKVTLKSKTIFWLSVIKNSFRMTFYFTDKAETLINKSNISNELKESFRKGKKLNKIRGITITFNSRNDVEYAKALIEIKLNLK
jgi:Protein of unknown function (DUF3788)